MEDRGNTYYCPECQFVFGKTFVADLGKNFDAYHAGLHKQTATPHPPENFRDIANGE